MDFGQIHHIEYYVNDLRRSNLFWDWFMPSMGYTRKSEWENGVSWAHGNGTYIVFVQVEERFQNHKNSRHGNGLNHIAFKGGSITDLDRMESDLRLRGLRIIERDDDYLCFEDPNNFAIEVYANKTESQ